MKSIRYWASELAERNKVIIVDIMTKKGGRQVCTHYEEIKRAWIKALIEEGFSPVVDFRDAQYWINW